MADEIIIETTSAEVIEVGVPGPQGPAGAAGTGLETLTTQGDTLYRGASTGERLPIGSAGQVLKVVNGLPAWANESGAVTSVNGATGAVTVAAATHATRHEAGNEDELQATAALVDTDYLPLNGVYFWDGTTTGGRPNFFKTGTRKNTKLEYNSGNNQWKLIRNNVVEAVGVDGSNTVPWGHTWEQLVTPTTVSVTQLPLETMVQKLAETGGAATATTSEDGLMSSSDKTKLNGIAAGAEVNVQANWTEADSGSDAFILNKPSTFAPSSHSSSHASAGSDPLALDGYTQIESALQDDPSQVRNSIGLQSLGGIEPAADGDVLKYDLTSETYIPTALGTAATADIGTGSTEVAAGDHGHELTALAATGATNGHVLTANGSNGATFAALPASGVTGAASSASDVLGVSGPNITGVDAGSADRLVFWDDSASKLTYLEAGSGLSISGTTLTATGGGVTTGSVDNAILRADGTGGSTSQSSDILIDDATTSTQNNVTISNQHSGQTNSALVLTPKGTGAFIVGPKPDGTAVGGNARGDNAIDIQTLRSAATHVASGASSIAIGVGSRASGVRSITIAALNAAATGDDCIAIGRDAAAGAGANAVAIARGASASGTSSIALSNNAFASAVNSTSVGAGSVADLRGMFSTVPFRSVYWSGQTTNNTATILNLDGTATNRFTIGASTALAVDILLIARRSDTQDKWLVARRFLGIRRDGSNNTSLIGSVQTLGTDQSEGSPTWAFALTADDTNEALQLEVTGAASETVQWRATAFYRFV